MVSKKTLELRWKNKEIYSSERYCYSCEQITKFKLNPVLGHSECTICLCSGKEKWKRID